MPPGKALLENLCMKAVNQSISELRLLWPWDEQPGLDGCWGGVTRGETFLTGGDLGCVL